MPETQKVAGNTAVVEQAAESSLLDQIVEKGRFSDPSARERGRPELLLYRKTAKSIAELDDRAGGSLLVVCGG